MKKIVIIDDEPLMRKNLTRILKTEKFQVTTAENGAKGLTSIRQNPPDLILCDVVMPRCDGFDFLQKIKSSRETASTPIILISGKSEKTTVRHGMSLGADDYLVKPFTSGELLNAIKSQLDKQAAHHSRLREKLALKSHFVSAVMHDFRSPLSILLLSIDTLEEDLLRIATKQRQELFADMRRQIKHMNRMLEDILALGQMESGAWPVRSEPVDLPALCREVIKDIQFVNQDNHPVKLVVNAMPKSIKTDELLLRQIINNLLTNAIKHSACTRPIILNLRREKMSTIIEVCDRGIGIPAEDHQRIFQPFLQGENASPESGSGYGLYIVKSYLDRLGGKLRIASQPNEGSIFSVCLPMEKK